MNRKDRLFQIAVTQQGFFTAKQAKACGYYDSNFHRHISSGDWTREGRGIYRLARYPFSDRPDLMEWSLWSRDKGGEVQGVFSHDTALSLYRVSDIMPADLHMTVPGRFRKTNKAPSHLRIYHSNLTESDWREQQGYRVTTLPRTLLDLAKAEEISLDLLQQAVREGRAGGMLTPQEVDSLPTTKEGQLIRKFFYDREPS